jgi:hypothetical protein
MLMPPFQVRFSEILYFDSLLIGHFRHASRHLRPATIFDVISPLPAEPPQLCPHDFLSPPLTPFSLFSFDDTAFIPEISLLPPLHFHC